MDEYGHGYSNILFGGLLLCVVGKVVWQIVWPKVLEFLWTHWVWKGDGE